MLRKPRAPPLDGLGGVELCAREPGERRGLPLSALWSPELSEPGPRLLWRGTQGLEAATEEGPDSPPPPPPPPHPFVLLKCSPDTR